MLLKRMLNTELIFFFQSRDQLTKETKEGKFSSFLSKFLQEPLQKTPTNTMSAKPPADMIKIYEQIRIEEYV